MEKSDQTLSLTSKHTVQLERRSWFPPALASSAVSEDRPLKTVPQVTRSFESAAAAGVFRRHHCLRTGLHAAWTGAVRDPRRRPGHAPGGPLSRPDGGEASVKQAHSANRLASFLEPIALLS